MKVSDNTDSIFCKVFERDNERYKQLVKGIKEGKLNSDFYVSKYSPDGIRSSDIWIEEIKFLVNGKLLQISL